MPASASAATAAGWVFGSSFTHARADVSRYSAIPPSCDRPGKELSVQCMSSPARQARHSPQDGVERAFDARLGHLVDDGLLMVTMDPDSLHWALLSSSGACPRPAESYLCRSMPRQMLLFASMLMRVVRARRRCSGAASPGTRSPVAGSISSGAAG